MAVESLKPCSWQRVAAGPPGEPVAGAALGGSGRHRVPGVRELLLSSEKLRRARGAGVSHLRLGPERARSRLVTSLDPSSVTFRKPSTFLGLPE